jgi:hypothetical protein
LLSADNSIARASLDIALPRLMLRRPKVQISNLTVADLTGVSLARFLSGLLAGVCGSNRSFASCVRGVENEK